MTIDFMNITRSIHDEHIFDVPSICYKKDVEVMDAEVNKYYDCLV